MDYIKLKKTLMAVFDHFLSCYDAHDLEQMMQAFEAGKGLNIRLPEKIHRNDYKHDVLAHEEQKKHDVLAHEEQKKHDIQNMNVPAPKVIRSRVRTSKPKDKTEATEQMEHICNVPIIMSLDKLTKEKRLLLRDVLKDNKHKITLKDTAIQDMHGFATARISRIVKRKKCKPTAEIPFLTSKEDTENDRAEGISDRISSHEIASQYTQRLMPQRNHKLIGHGNISKKTIEHAQKHTKTSFREKLIKEISKRIKKHKDPP